MKELSDHRAHTTRRPPDARALPCLLVLGMLCLNPSAPARAGEEGPMDRLQLTASASREVIADRLRVRLHAQAEGRDPGRLADQVNRRIRKAVEKAQRVPGVQVETEGYATSPIYRDQRLAGWRVRQSIRLRGPDLGTLSRLLGDLQKELVLDQMAWEVSPPRRDEVLAGLRREAVARFRDKARALASAFGYRGYRLVQASVNDGGTSPGPVPYRMMAMKAESVQPPALAPAGQTISVTISGTVELNDTPGANPQ
ncbi:MAG: DUF541 domain-containing protein [Gammaproteobacteria bacterium]|nr:MAG: DUF541 domain-containing protein [Gammaproteobacteria bacterium]